MLSVMNNNDFKFDRNHDVIDDSPQSIPRVTDDHVVVPEISSSDKDTNGEGDGGLLEMIGSEEIGGSQFDAVRSSNKVTHGGGCEKTGLDSIGFEGVMVSSEHGNGSDEIGIAETDCRSYGEVESGRFENANEVLAPTDSDNQVSFLNDVQSRIEGDGVDSCKKGLVDVTPGPSDQKVNDCNVEKDHLSSRSGKGHVEVGKSSIYQYDSLLSMFDEYVANEKGKAVAVGSSTPLGYDYEIGDMVWGKVKSHPWWPGHVYNEAFASPSVRRTKREGDVLVAFFGDSSYGWFDPSELVPFDPNFTEKSRQTNSRAFTKAVEEALDESNRRHAMGLACQCRNPFSFRPTDVQDYYAVDVADYEPAGFYSVNQIKKARDSFQPRETLAFIRQLALMPIIQEHPSSHFINNKATVFAYRKAVFEEFDETYAQAFGTQPGLSSRGPTVAVAQNLKEPSRAPLSGPLVIAEALGKGKNSKKPIKAKDQAKKDRYLFKRRDEPNEMKTQENPSIQPAYVDGSLDLAAEDNYLSQKRDLGVSSKPQTPAKQEQTGIIGEDVTSTSIRDVTGKAGVTFGDEQEDGRSSDSKNDLQTPRNVTLVEDFQQSPRQAPGVEKLHGKQIQDSQKGSKKAKVLKRPLENSIADKSTLGGKKKKKREKILGTKMSSDHMQKHAATGKGSPLVGNQRKDDVATSSLLPGSVFPLPIIGMGNIEFELPQLLSDLQALALNPFDGVGRESPAIVSRVVLKFRSLVYQKSLAMLPLAETETNEARATKYPSGSMVSDNAQVDSPRDLPALKPPKPPLRPDDPTKGGRKRGPSDRQEEKAAKRVKKINELKTLTVEKKAPLKIPEAQRGDGKETAAPIPPKPVKLVTTKKPEPQAKAPDPTMLVMKFPTGTNLPSGAELKARLARFGPLDHSKTRVFYKSSTCRVVFQYKLDAHAAYKHLMGFSSVFGNANLICHLREAGDPSPESESGRVQTEYPSLETPPLRNAAVEQRLPVRPTQLPLQRPESHLKSCLKRSLGDEMGPVVGGNGGGGGGGRGTARVKFVLDGEESSSRGEELMMIGNKNNFFNNSSFADGGGTSSSHAMDLSSKNFQNVFPPSPLPILPLPSAQFPTKVPNNVFYTEVASSNTTNNFITTNNIDIARQMLSLLTRCNDVVANVTNFLGYVPYHPL